MKNNRKGGRGGRGHGVVEKILGILQTQAEISTHLLDVFLSASYGSSSRKLKRGPRSFKTNWAEDYRETQRFYAFMNRLKQEGFVVRESRGKESWWEITKKGEEKWKKLQEKAWWHVPDYATEDDGIVRIIAFDVPERERRNRIWLQAVLKRLGFTPIQKSVLMGTCRLPEAFLQDLRKKRMLSYIHIFEAGKRGTLQKIGI